MGHRGRHPILAQALHIFINYPALYLDIVYVHTPLSCYIIAHVSKLHTQALVNLVYRCIDIIMVALCNRADHYIFMLWFVLLLLLLSSFFFPRLISAVGDWMFTILWHMVWP